MKRETFSKFAIAALFFVCVGINAFLAIANCRPFNASFGPDNSLNAAYDFRLRRNEILCLRDGTDPYDVWTQKISKPPYYPYVKKELKSATLFEPINAYTPWTYSFLFPISIVSANTAWRFYQGLLILSLALLSFLGYRLGKSEQGNRQHGLLLAIVPLLMIIPWTNDLNSGNLPTLITCAALLLIFGMRSNNNILSGICWAFMMTKPQLGLLVAVPLLLRGKIRTCFVAAALCILGAIPPAILCGKSPIAMTIESPKACTHGFCGCALMPIELFDRMKDLAVPEPILWGFPMIAGAAICLWLTWKLRHENWCLMMSPAAICSLSWTYVQGHSHMLAIIPMMAITLMALRQPTPKRIALTVLTILLMARAGRFFEIGVSALLPGLNALGSIVCSLSSTAALACFVCLVLSYKTYKSVDKLR